MTRLLDDLAARKLRGQLPEGNVLTPDGINRPRPDFDDLQRQILADIDLLIPNSLLEAHTMARSLRVAVPFCVAPLGVDPLTFLDADPQPFVERFGVRDFVLQVARIEGTKNQVLLCRALRDAGMSTVYLTGSEKGFPTDATNHPDGYLAMGIDAVAALSTLLDQLGVK